MLVFYGGLSSDRAHTRGDACAGSVQWPERCNALLPAPYLKAITYIRTCVGQENGDCGGDRIGQGLEIVRANHPATFAKKKQSIGRRHEILTPIISGPGDKRNL